VTGKGGMMSLHDNSKCPCGCSYPDHWNDKPPARVRLIFAWYDFWIGFYLDRKGKKLFVFPIPMVGVEIRLGKTNSGS